MVDFDRRGKMRRAFWRSSEMWRANTLRLNDDMTISPLVGDTKLKFNPEELAEAENYVRHMGVTGADRIQPSAGIYGRDTARTTEQVARHLEAQFPERSVELQEIRFNIQDEAQLDAFESMYSPQREGAPARGFAVQDANVVRLIKGYVDGEEMSNLDLQRAFYEAQGVEENIVEPAGKLGKRMKAEFTPRQVEGEIPEGIRVLGVDRGAYADLAHYRATVKPQVIEEMFGEGVSEADLTPDQAEQVRARLQGLDIQARGRVEDGISQIGPDGIDKLERNLRRVANQYRGEASRMRGDNALALPSDQVSEEALNLERHARRYEDAAERMSMVRRHGTGGIVDNLRLSGFELDLGPETARLTQELREELMSNMSRMVKGAVIYNPNLPRGVDVITDIENIKREAGRPPGAPTRMTLEDMIHRPVPPTGADAPLEQTRWDVQSATSFPEVIDRQAVEESGRMAREDIDEMARRVMRGETPDEAIGILRSQAEIDPDTGRFRPLDHLDDPVSPQRARMVLEHIESGGQLRDFPDLARTLVRHYHGQDVRGSHEAGRRLGTPAGEPFYRGPLPDTVRAHVMPSSILESVGVDPDKLPGPGQLRYISDQGPQGVFAISASDTALRHFTFGGFDFDDVLNNMIRFDATADTLEEAIHGLVYRQPNTIGEFARMEVPYYDDAIRRLMDKKGVGERYDELVGDVRAGRTAGRQPLWDLLRENLRGADDTIDYDKIPSRIGERIDIGDGQYRFQGDVEGQVFQDVSGPETERMIARPWEQVGPEDAETHRQLVARQQERVIRNLRSVVGEDAGIVGQFSNMMMFRNHWLATHRDKLAEHDMLRRFTGLTFEHETVIDAFAQGEGAEFERMQRMAQTDPDGVTRAIRQAGEEQVRNVFRAAAEARVVLGEDLAVDPALMDWKGMDAARVGRDAIAETEQRLAAQGADIDSIRGAGPEAFLMDPDDHRATISAMREQSRRTSEYVHDINRGLSFLEEFDDVPGIRSRRTQEDAERLLQAARRARDTEQQVRGAMGVNFERSARQVALADFAEAASEMFEMEQAGPRFYRAALRAAQIEEAAGGPANIPYFTEHMGIGGADAAEATPDRMLWLRAQQWARGQDVAAYTAADIYDELGQTLRHGPGVDDIFQTVMDRYLPSGQFDPEGLSRAAEVVDEHGNRTSLTHDQRIAEIFGPDPYHAHIEHDEYLRGVKDPDALVRRPDGTYEQMGELTERVRRAYQAGEVDSEAERTMREVIATERERMRRWQELSQEDPDVMHGETRQRLHRALGTEEPPGSAYYQRTAQASDQATQTAAYRRIDTQSIMDLMRSADGRVGRAVGWGALGVGALAVYGMLTGRDDDFTWDQMQGPAHSPGGNPYDLQNHLAAVGQRETDQRTPLSNDYYSSGDIMSEGSNFDISIDGHAPDELMQDISNILGRSIEATERGRSIRNQINEQQKMQDRLLNNYAGGGQLV